MAIKRQKKTNLRSKVRWGIAGIVALLIISVVFDAPVFANRVINKINNTVSLGIPTITEKPFSLGLDLQGGAHLVYQADVQNIVDTERSTAVEGVRDVIERRVNGLGVGEPNVQTAKVSDEYRIIVELPGVTDVATAISMIGETPILEFKEQNNEPTRELNAEEKKQLEAFNTDAKNRIDGLLKRIQNKEAFDMVAKEASEDDASKNNGGYMGYLAKSSPYGELYAWAGTVKEGVFTQAVIPSVEGLNLLKRGAERDGEKEVSAKHILICYLGAARCEGAAYNKDEARAKALEVYEKANANNFADLAKEFSTEPGVAQTGGDLGFFTQEAMVKPFADAAFSAKVGQIIGPVETEFGYHIIYKTGEQMTKEYEVSRILVRTKTEQDILPPQDQWKNTGLSGKQLERAQVVTDQQTGEVQVSLQFNSEGTDLFRQVTERNLQKPVAIFLDGEPISIPNVNQIIPNGQAIISGGFTLTEAKLLSQRLNAGALPVPVELISQQTVGATLGAESLQASLKAGLVALLLVMLFMVLYYRIPGVIAVFGLMVYAAVSLAIFKLMGVTLTLAGIAGFILSIGMAVDANILVFERMKEELRAGKSLRLAVEEGFLRAWLSIRDGNTSVLITCVILVWFGSSFVQGFAVTLIVGTLISIFSAVTVTRTCLRFVVPWFKEEGNWLFLGHKKKIDPVTE